jgi:phosphohistidine phosphatase
MRTLVLLRHAKSAWDDPALPDLARPLSARGRRDAPRIGQALADRGLVPGAVLLSPSARTRETWELMAPHLPGAAAPVVVPDIYLGRPEELLAALRAAPATAGTVFMIGHEPGIPGLLRLLAAEAVPADCARAFAKFPTGAAAVLRFDTAGWSGTAPGTGRFEAFLHPKDLA